MGPCGHRPAGDLESARTVIEATLVGRGKRRFRTRLAQSISLAKRVLPTGEPIDDILNYVHAWVRLGYAPHIFSPRSFNEHILSSKWRFRGDIDLARKVTDKFLFKGWLQEKGHEKLVVPTLGLYNDANEVRNLAFDRNTILKPTHLSGGAILIYESRKSLHTDYYKRSREKTYKGVCPRLICEPLLLDSTGKIPMDYKFFMCLGKPLMVQVDLDRFTNHTRQLYSTNWELLNFELKFPRNPNAINRPKNLATAFDVASTLSSDFPFCRVDLYLLPNDTIKAGEITFFPEGGGGNFLPMSADFLMGDRMKELLGNAFALSE